MKWLGLCLLGLVLGGSPVAHAGGEVVPRLVIDGVTYQDIRWGPVNAGKVTFFHNRGIAMDIPLAKLPERYQRQFGYQPDAAAEPAGPAAAAAPVMARENSADSAYARMKREQVQRQQLEAQAKQQAFDTKRQKLVMFEGKLVEKDQLTELTGFLQARAEFSEGETVVRGVIIEPARLRNPRRQIPAYLLMRPGLWERTGEEVFLKNYPLTDSLGSLVRLYGREIEPLRGMRAFIVGTEPTR